MTSLPHRLRIHQVVVSIRAAAPSPRVATALFGWRAPIPVKAIVLLLDQKGQYHHDIWPHGLLPDPPIRSSDVLAIAEAFKEFTASRAAWGVLYAYVEAYASSLTADAVTEKKIGDWLARTYPRPWAGTASFA